MPAEFGDPEEYRERDHSYHRDCSIHSPILSLFKCYRRFIAGPTLNNSKKEEVDFFWKLSLNVVENVAKVEFFFFLVEYNFSTLINYLTNMC